MKTTDNESINQLLSARELLGLRVRSRLDEELGKVIDLRMDPADGRALFGLVSFGSIWGLGGKVFAVPFHAFRYSENEKALYLDIEKEQFEKASAADIETWSVSRDGKWGEREVFLLHNAEQLIRWSGQ